MIEFDVIFEGARVPTWLRAFERAPLEAVEDLLAGRADLGLLSAEEPSALLLDWLAGIGDQDGFADEIDEALAWWIDNSWGNPTLESANRSASLTAVAWCRAADVIAMDERLDKSADYLRQHVTNDRRFLNALHEGRGRDPMARAWLAIARHQQDRRLVDQWWRLCSIPPDEPWYRGAFGIHGLRGLPPADQAKKGGFAEEVADGLAMLACALRRHQEEGWLQEKPAENEFLRTARMTTAAYPFPKEWQAFWRHAVERYDNQPPRGWVKKIVRLDTVETRGFRNKPANKRQWIQRDPRWAQIGKRIAARLGHGDWNALPDAEELLEAQQQYAEATGDTYNVVRTASNFAGRVRKQRPGLALKWAELARHFEPWDSYAWTTNVSALSTLGRQREAVNLALQAVERFPENVVARNGLAEVLKAEERFDEAESVYRDTVERFPEDVVARTGLAEVLKAEERFDEAESVYRDTIERFPDDVFARNGLASILKAVGRYEEAVGLLAQVGKTADEQYEAEPTGLEGPTVIAENLERAFADADKTHGSVDAAGPADRVAPEQAVAAAESAEDRSEATPGLRAEDVGILLADAYLLRRWQSRSMHREGQQPTGAIQDRAQDLLERLMPLIGRDSRAASEAGLLALEQEDLEQAVRLLSEASERFRGSVRVHYALARAQRELARVRQRSLSSEAETEVIVPWRRLSRIDEHCRPVHLLGEGRAWLTLSDGATVEENARNAFGRLGRWLARQIEPTDCEVDPNATPLEEIRDRFAPHEGADRFFGWWAREVQTYVFGEEAISRAEDLEELAPIRDRIDQYSRTLDQIEEECVARFDRA